MSVGTGNRLRVLVVDDEDHVRESLGDWLRVCGLAPMLADSAQGARRLLAAQDFDLVVTDLRMPGGDGIGLLDHVLANHRDVPVILLTAHADVSLAVDAMRRGAHDFLEKPYDADHLLNVVLRAGENGRLKRDLAALRGRVDALTGIDRLLPGVSPAAEALRQQVLAVAAARIDVCVLGGFAAGSHAVARAIHAADPHGGGLQTIDCAVLSEGQVEAALSEVCHRARHDGPQTLMIAQIEAMGRHARDRMAQLFAGRSLPVRRIALPGEAVAAGSAVADDIAVLVDAQTIAVPPLGERPEDVSAIFAMLVAEAAVRAGVDAPPPSIETMAMVTADPALHDFARLRSHAMAHVLGLDTAGGDVGSALSEGGDLRAIMARVEREIIQRALDTHGGNKAAAARALGIPRRTLGERLQKMAGPGGADR